MNDTILLSEIGRALYGEHWEAILSRQMRVSDRSMRRWANGTDRIPWGVWFDVYKEVETRAQNLDHWKTLVYNRVVIRECEEHPTKKYNAETDWLIEVHDPESGRHSRRHSAILPTLADVRALMKEYPGMTFRVTMPFGATANDRQEFCQMNVARL